VGGQSGWMTRSISLDYLTRLPRRYLGEPIVLLWDLFAAHRNINVKALAERPSIRLGPFLPGTTGLHQPLDRSTFGALNEIHIVRSSTALSNLHRQSICCWILGNQCLKTRFCWLGTISGRKTLSASQRSKSPLKSHRVL
jgi:hypothetical protein